MTLVEFLDAADVAYDLTPLTMPVVITSVTLDIVEQIKACSDELSTLRDRLPAVMMKLARDCRPSAMLLLGAAGVWVALMVPEAMVLARLSQAECAESIGGIGSKSDSTLN